MSIKLSLCIPTYNRASCIEGTLNSIISQATDEVEIIVSDNASSDNIAEIIRGYQQRFPRITYFRWDENMGADRNFLKTVELATGEYCWFMGDDDIIEEGGVAAVLEALSKYDDLAGITVNRYAYSPDMSHKISDRPVAGGRLNGDVVFTNYEESILLLGNYFGFASAQVFHRRLWNEVIGTDDPTPFIALYPNYIQVYVILSILKINPRWLYLDRRCVGWRSGASSFKPSTVYENLEKVVKSHEKILIDLFGRGTPPYDSLMKTIANVDVRYAILKAKLKGAPTSFFFKALILCINKYWRYPVFWLKTFPLFMVPRPLLQIAHGIYRGVKS